MNNRKTELSFSKLCFVLKKKLNLVSLCLGSLLFLIFVDVESFAEDSNLKEYCFVRSVDSIEIDDIAVLFLTVPKSQLTYENMPFDWCEKINRILVDAESSIKQDNIENSQTIISFYSVIELNDLEFKVNYSLGVGPAYYTDPVVEYFENSKRVCGVEISKYEGLYRKIQDKSKLGCSFSSATYYSRINNKFDFISFHCQKASNSCLVTFYLQGWEVSAAGVPEEVLPQWADLRDALLADFENSFSPQYAILRCSGGLCRE